MASYSAALGSDPFGIVHFAGHLSRGMLFSDFPVYDWFKRDWAPGEAHFVLHGNYIADGQRLFCKYTIGFPLILAGFIRVLGPGSVYFANVVVLVILLAAEYGLARSFLRNFTGDRLLALIAPILLMVLVNKIWGLALRPARDLSALALLVLGFYLGAVGLGRAPRLRWGAVGAGAFCLGFAGSVRFPNVLAAVPAFVYLLERLLRKSTLRRGTAAVLLAVLCFGLGLVPALYQNLESTGNFLKPPRPEIVDRNPVQVEGETNPPPLWLGFFKTTAPETLGYFWRLYGPFFLGLILLGAAALRRSPGALIVCLGVPAVFVLFYSMWVHLMIRYMMVAQPFLVVLAVAGCGYLLAAPRRWAVVLLPPVLLLDWAARSRLPHAYGLEYVDTPVLIFGVFLWIAAAWPSRPRRARLRVLFLAAGVAAVFLGRYPAVLRDQAEEAFQLPQARRLGADIDALVPPGSVIFATKPVSEYINLFTRSYSLRPFEMARMRVETRAGIERILERGTGVFLIESSGWKRDARKAEPSLLYHFDLKEAGAVRGADYNLEKRFGRPVSRIFEVVPWRPGPVSSVLKVPAGDGPWLFSLDARAFNRAGPRRAEVALGGLRLASSLENGRNFFVVPRGALPGPEAVLTVDASDPVPRDLAPRLQPLDRPWEVDLGAEPDFPGDYARDGFSEARLRDADAVRLWWGQTGRAVVPTPGGSGYELFAVLKLANVRGAPRPAFLRVALNGTPVADLDLSDLARGWREYRVALPSRALVGLRGVLELTPFVPAGNPISPDENRVGAFLAGGLVVERCPLQLGMALPPGKSSFLAFQVESGEGATVCRPPYVFFVDSDRLGEAPAPGVQRVLLPPGPGGGAFLEAFSRQGGCRVPFSPEYLLVPSAPAFEIDVGGDADWAFAETGFYGAERHLGTETVRWTSGLSRLVVPLFSGMETGGEVRFRAFNLAPPAAGPISVTVRLAGRVLGTVSPPPGEGVYRFPFSPDGFFPRLAVLEFESSTWRPSDFGGGADDRELGVMLDWIRLGAPEDGGRLP